MGNVQSSGRALMRCFMVAIVCCSLIGCRKMETAKKTGDQSLPLRGAGIGSVAGSGTCMDSNSVRSMLFKIDLLEERDLKRLSDHLNLCPDASDERLRMNVLYRLAKRGDTASIENYCGTLANECLLDSMRGSGVCSLFPISEGARRIWDVTRMRCEKPK